MLEPLYMAPYHSTLQAQKLRGFAAFVLSNSVRIYSLINAPLNCFLYSYLDILRRHTKFRMPMCVATKAGTVYTDATPFAIAAIDKQMNTTLGRRVGGCQAHNEALALLTAILAFGRRRTYCTDVLALLGLAKRSSYLLPFKTIAAIINPRINFVSSAANLADAPSRDPGLWQCAMPKNFSEPLCQHFLRRRDVIASRVAASHRPLFLVYMFLPAAFSPSSRLPLIRRNYWTCYALVKFSLYRL